MSEVAGTHHRPVAQCRDSSGGRARRCRGAESFLLGLGREACVRVRNPAAMRTDMMARMPP